MIVVASSFYSITCLGIYINKLQHSGGVCFFMDVKNLYYDGNTLSFMAVVFGETKGWLHRSLEWGSFGCQLLLWVSGRDPLPLWGWDCILSFGVGTISPFLVRSHMDFFCLIFLSLRVIHFFNISPLHFVLFSRWCCIVIGYCEFCYFCIFARWVSDKSALTLTLKRREFRIWNKTNYTGNGGSSVYGTPKRRRKAM